MRNQSKHTLKLWGNNQSTPWNNEEPIKAHPEIMRNQSKHTPKLWGTNQSTPWNYEEPIRDQPAITRNQSEYSLKLWETNHNTAWNCEEKNKFFSQQIKLFIMRHLLNPSLYFPLNCKSVELCGGPEISRSSSHWGHSSHTLTHTQNTHHREKQAALLLFLSYFVLSYETLIFSLSLSLFLFNLLLSVFLVTSLFLPSSFLCMYNVCRTSHLLYLFL